MSDPKYKINANLLDTRGGIAKLERDGFSRERIHKEMYKVTEGASTQERTKIMANLYKRKEPC